MNPCSPRKLISLQQAFETPLDEANHYYRRHVNDKLLSLYSILGTGNLEYTSALGSELKLADGTTVLDFTSAMGSLSLGHNHRRIVAAERACHNRELVDIMKVGPSRIQGVLAYNIAQLLGPALDTTIFCVTGAEAVEAAMKLCEIAQGPKRRKFLVATGSFHGKSHTTLSITKSGDYARGVLQGLPPECILEVPFGDADAAREQIAVHADSIVAAILEPIQGQAVVVPPDGYLNEMGNLCKDAGILLVFDETKVGLCRTGRMFAYEWDAAAPDALVFGKALGGGKRAISVVATSRELFRKAYGKRQSCALQTTTFGGIGESCAVAIEALNIMVDQGLAAQAESKGAYLHAGLQRIQERFPAFVRETRGRGLFQGIRLRLRPRVTAAFGALDTKTVKSATAAAFINYMLRKHRILLHFLDSDPDVIHIMPPLTASTEELDRLLYALEATFEAGLARIASNFAEHLGEQAFAFLKS